MKLLDAGRATNPRRVKIFLQEKGIEIEMEQIDLASDAHKTPEFTALNPAQTVPVLILDDGTALSETMAICRYMEELHPEPPLMGVDPLDRALVDMWSRRMEFNVAMRAAHVFRHLHPAMGSLENPQVAQWGEANKEKVMFGLNMMDRALADTRFIAGERFTVADITAKVGCDLLKPGRLSIPDELEHVLRWYAEVSVRPAVAAHP
jgi:glutathione S-transferase